MSSRKRRIVVDLQGAQSTGSRGRGIGRYSLSLTEGMIRNAPDHEFILVVNAAFADAIPEVRQRFSGLLPQANIVSFHVTGPVEQLSPDNDDRRLGCERLREAFIASLNPDAVHITSLFEGLTNDSVVSIGKQVADVPTSVTLYDLIPLIHSDIYLTDRRVRRWYHDRIDNLRRADHLLSISDSSGQEAIRYLGLSSDQVTNVGTAADDAFTKAELSATETASLLRRYGLRPKVVMYTGGIDYRKNIEGLIEAYAGLPRETRADVSLAIVCSCSDADRKRLLRLAADCGLSGQDVVLTGFVPEADLIGLYSICTLFVFPSWHEGFGLPALEAMHCGAAVVGSNRSSLPEVIGLDAAMFDPFDISDIQKVLERGLSDEQYLRQLRVHGAQQRDKFSWDKTARRALGVIETLAAEKARDCASRLKPTSRPSLAYVSPVPPDQSGVASYSAELIPELSRHYRIECIVPDGFQVAEGFLDSVGAFVEFRPVSSFLADRGRSFDRVIYNIGNSEFHMHMFSMLEQVPGVIDQHDLFLSGVLAHMENQFGIANVWWQALYQSHGYAALLDRVGEDGFMGALWKYPSSTSVFEQAVGAIVHGPSTRQLAAKWMPSHIASKIEVIPHLRVLPATNDRASARSALDLPDDEILVCSFGIMGETKLSHRLLEAWAALGPELPSSCRLIFVGQAPGGEYGDVITAQVSRAIEAGAEVTITGWANDAQYRLYLQACDVAVQLRAKSRGETSGAILDCMAYGKPTIVNAHGSAADLPEEGVVKIQDQFSEEQLVEALRGLLTDPEKRGRLGGMAEAIIRHEHSPRRCAESFATAIEKAYALHRNSAIGFARSEAGHPGVLSGEDLTAFARSIAATMAPSDPGLCYVDVSAFDEAFPAVLAERLKQDVLSTTRRIEPITWSRAEGRFVYARKSTLDALGLPSDILEDREPVVLARGCECVVFYRDSQTEIDARERWELPAALNDIGCQFEKLR